MSTRAPAAPAVEELGDGGPDLDVARAAERVAAPPRARSRERAADPRRAVARLFLYLILLLGGLAMIFPFVWMVASSLKHAAEIYSLSLLPADPTLENYATVFRRTQFVRWF